MISGNERDTQDSIHDAASDYARWNDAIGRHFFSQQSAQSFVRLAFDDSAALTIGRAFDESTPDLCRAVTSLVSVESYRPFAALLRAGGAGVDYPALALLAVQVLAASRMGEDPHADVQRYWPIFTELIGGELTQKQIDEQLDPLWIECEAFYRETFAGTRGLLTLPPDPFRTPLRNKRHINYPLWQCALREVDREQLRRRFQIASASELQASAGALPSLVRTWPDLNLTLRNTLNWARENPEFEHQLGDLLEEIREQARQTDFRPDDRRRKLSRLRLAGLRRLRCYLQVRSGAGQWLDAGPDGAPLSVDQVMNGVEADLFGGSWSGAQRLAFLDAGNEGYVYLRGSLNGRARVILIYLGDDPAALSLHSDDRWKKRELSEELAETFEAVEGEIDPELDGAIAELFSIQLLCNRRLALEGGLRIGGYGSIQYLVGAPPRIHVLAPTGAKLLLDGKEIDADGDGIAWLKADLAIGVHEAEYDSGTLQFEIVAVDESLNESGDDLGWVLSPAGRMEVENPEEMDHVPILVGAELKEE